MEETFDQDLRDQLISYGEDVGPLNNSTRPYWKKRLSYLQKNNGPSAGNTANPKSSLTSSGKNNHTRKISEKKNRKIQLRDKRLLDSLRENGIKVPRRTLDDGLRIEYQNKLDALMVNSTSENYKNENLKRSLIQFGVPVPDGPLNDAARHQLEQLLYKLKRGVLTENDFQDDAEYTDDDDDEYIFNENLCDGHFESKLSFWGYIREILTFVKDAAVCTIFVIGFAALVLLVCLGLGVLVENFPMS